MQIPSRPSSPGHGPGDGPGRPRASLPALVAALLLAPTLHAASLIPTQAGLYRQVRAAQRQHAVYLENARQVESFVRRGFLVRLPGNDDYTVKEGLPFPYARPEVKELVERLAADYHEACGEPLVVTSLVRPRDHQPRNASRLSVHPTGMAMDLRRSWSHRCRGWLERVLLGLEDQGVLEAARERHPPHYHVVVFPHPFEQYLAQGGEIAPDPTEAIDYRVRRGDTLWKIARRFGTTVAVIQSVNGLRSTLLRRGQVLTVPAP